MSRSISRICATISAIKGIRRVVMHEALTNLRPVVFLQFAKARRRPKFGAALHGAANFRAGVGKIVIAVSEDIDPANTDAVLWSMAYRWNPIEDVHIAPHRARWAGLAIYSGRQSDSTLLIDATLKHDMPPLALPAKEFMEGARKIWEELGLPPLAAPPALARLLARRLDRDLGTSSPAASPRGNGRRMARRRWRVSAAGSCRKRRSGT